MSAPARAMILPTEDAVRARLRGARHHHEVPTPLAGQVRGEDWRPRDGRIIAALALLLKLYGEGCQVSHLLTSASSRSRRWR